MTSEFGQGLCYCLALFLCHSERDYLITGKDIEKGIINKPYLWFYGASDHLYDLQIPQDFPDSIKKRLSNFQNKVLHWRMPMDRKTPTKKDKKWAIQEAKDLIRLIDKHFGIEVEKGEWE